MKKKALLTLLISISLFFLNSCMNKKATDFVEQLNNAIGSQYYFVEKVQGEGPNTKNFVVLRVEIGGITKYGAINLADYEAGMDITTFISGLGLWDKEEITRIGGSDQFRGNDSGWIYEETQISSGKDLELLASFEEDYRFYVLGEFYADRFGLTEKRGLEIAKLITNWKIVERGRTMSEKDAEVVVSNILGFTMAEGNKAYAKKELENDSTDFDRLLKIAAHKNKITPEKMNELFNELKDD